MFLNSPRAKTFSTSSFAVRFARALILPLFAILTASLAAAPPVTRTSTDSVALRGYGKVTARFSPNEAVFACEDARHADILLGKLLADLFWDANGKDRVIAAKMGEARARIHFWPPYGAIAAARNGAQVIAMGADSPDQLLTRMKREPRLLSPNARYSPEKEYPRYLDFYDLRAFKSYDHSMRSALDLGLENHWPFVKKYGLGGLAFQSLSLGKSSAAPGVADWSAVDYEMREAEKRNGMAVLGIAAGGEMPLWMYNQHPESAMKPSPHALIGAWGGASAAGGHYESWSIPTEQAENTSMAFLRQAMMRYKDNPALGGWHPYRGSPGVEYGFHERTDEFWDFSPAGQEGFRTWLRKVRGFSIAALGRRWHGDPKRFKSWSQVTLPDPQSFYGSLNGDSLPIQANWKRMSAGKLPVDAVPVSADPDWTPVAMPPSSQQDFFPWGAAYYRVDFDSTDWLAGHQNKDQYLVVGADIRSQESVGVWLNGESLGAFKSTAETGPFSAKLTGRLQIGTNELILRVPGASDAFSEGKIYGPVFVTTTEPKFYPYLGEHENARYVDFREWQMFALAHLHEAMLQEARAIDPDRPMILSGGGIEMGNYVAEMATRYGMGAQMTGREAWYFPWWSGQGHLAGFYGTGEPSANVFGPYLDRMMGWVLSDCDGNLDLFWTLESYMKDNQESRWFDKHRRLIQLFGKALRPNPGLAIFRSAESNLLDPQVTGYGWDMGRGDLQAAHYDNFYATEWELSRGLVRGCPILTDSGSQILSDDEIRDISRYVKAGGTFVALHNTGWHGILKPNAYPLSRISGFKPDASERMGVLRFGDHLPVFKGWEGKRFKAWGFALAPVPGLTGSLPLARWEDGSIAIGYRKLGKGGVIVLGSTFWRDGQAVDDPSASRLDGQVRFFDRLFADLGVRRTANASSRDVWTRKAVSKNGLQDWLIAFNSSEKPVVADVSLRAEGKPLEALNLVTRKPVTFAYADGWVHLANVAFGPYETVIFGVKRASLIGGIPAWWAEKTKYWKACDVSVNTPSVSKSPSATKEPETLAAERWKFYADKTGATGNSAAWKTLRFDDSHWRTLANGPWNLQDDRLKSYRGVGLYRAVVHLPAGWAGHRILLGMYSFDTPIVYDDGEFFVNGERVIRYKARGWSQTLKYDVTDKMKPGDNLLAVKALGGSMFSGVSGAIWFEPETRLDSVLDLAGEWSLVKGSVGSEPSDAKLPVAPSGLYLRKDFVAPRAWAGRTVYLRIDMPDQWLGSIAVNGHPSSYNDFLHPYPLLAELNVTPFLKPGESNRIELWPFQSVPGQGRAAPTGDQRMSVDAIRAGCLASPEKAGAKPAPRPAGTKAMMSDKAADLIGVNTHLPYQDVYGSVWNSIIRPRLLESGIRHIRDWLVDDPAVIGEYRDLAAHGITGLLINFDNDPAKREIVKNQLNRAAPKFVDAVEPPNEQDNTGDDWIEHARNAQIGLWNGYKKDPALKGIWILGPSFADTRDSPAKLLEGAPDIGGYMDHGDLHDYTGGQSPEGPYGGGWGISMDSAISHYRRICGDDPLVSGETGFHDAVGYGLQPGISERAAAKLMPRLVLEKLRRGYARVYFYEFYDEGTDPKDMERNFGLARHDGTPKLQFNALKSFISLFSDKGAAFETGSLDYALVGDKTGIRQMLLQKRDGRFYLIVWQGTDSFDLVKNVDIEPPARKLTLKFNQPVASVKTYLPTFDGAKARASYDHPRILNLSVPDHLLVVEITPSKRRR